jgi:hypothetical protein
MIDYNTFRGTKQQKKQQLINFSQHQVNYIIIY